MAATEPALDRNEAVAALEAQLARTSKALRPHEHAVLAYRLGLAYAESADADDGMRRALALYDVAAGIFDPRHDPTQHARVLNAAGAAHRVLGATARAAALFEQAAKLLERRGRDDERAAALSNLGLTRAEAGEPERALAAFDGALDLFDAGSAEGRRGRAAALLNRGLARAAVGDEQSLDTACADYRAAREELDRKDAPYHVALAHHSEGVARYALAGLRPAERAGLLRDAEAQFRASLSIFTRRAFPYHHALARYNLGLVFQAGEGSSGLRRALACFEEAVALFDPRLHPGPWGEAYRALERVERALGGGSRAEHFAILVAGCDEDERWELLRDRLTRLLALPEPARHSALVELAEAVARLGRERTEAVLETQLGVLMELPADELEAGLRAQFEARRRLDEGTRDAADRALDAAIGEALGPPQRLYVRDFLSSLGFERP